MSDDDANDDDDEHYDDSDPVDDDDGGGSKSSSRGRDHHRDADGGNHRSSVSSGGSHGSDIEASRQKGKAVARRPYRATPKASEAPFGPVGQDRNVTAARANTNDRVDGAYAASSAVGPSGVSRPAVANGLAPPYKRPKISTQTSNDGDLPRRPGPGHTSAAAPSPPRAPAPETMPSAAAFPSAFAAPRGRLPALPQTAGGDAGGVLHASNSVGAGAAVTGPAESANVLSAENAVAKATTAAMAAMAPTAAAASTDVIRGAQPGLEIGHGAALPSMQMATSFFGFGSQGGVPPMGLDKGTIAATRVHPDIMARACAAVAGRFDVDLIASTMSLGGDVVNAHARFPGLSAPMFPWHGHVWGNLVLVLEVGPSPLPYLRRLVPGEEDAVLGTLLVAARQRMGSSDIVCGVFLVPYNPTAGWWRLVADLPMAVLSMNPLSPVIPGTEHACFAVVYMNGAVGAVDHHRRVAQFCRAFVDIAYIAGLNTWSFEPPSLSENSARSPAGQAAFFHNPSMLRRP